MKVKLIFDTFEEQDREDLKIYKQTKGMYAALHDISMRLRSLYKYEDLSDKTADELIDQIRDLFSEALSDNNVDLDI